MELALIVLLPLLGAVIPPIVIRLGRNVCASATGAVTALSLLILLVYAPAVYAGDTPRWSVDWLPHAGLAFSFFLDGLGFFFAALILGMGLLIILYARYYLGPADPMGQFYSYLLLFQGAMLGIVLSDNVVLLVVFWELTSLSSFLLIGYWRHKPQARQGARMALVVTAAGGLALLAGVLILGHIAGSYELSELLRNGDRIKASPLYGPALLLILGGAFTKSAQFPFHFWLPHAMAAPTPVSAYLHSATMVKAGVFLLARLWPVLAGTETWFLIVATTGLVTFLVGGWIALFKDDLKAVLAYSTVSHLGLMTMLLGLGTPMAVVVAAFHILNHATFKAALFMSAGIVDHETGTRDIRRLGGLLTLMPITATLSLIAAASMAGLPFLNGYVSKEMMLEEAWRTSYLGLGWLFPSAAMLGALISVLYSVRYAADVFMGAKRDGFSRLPHDPPAGLWLPVAILVVPILAIGFWPALAEPIVRRTASAITGGDIPDVRLAIWHGLTPAFFMSVAAIIGGFVLLAGYSPIKSAVLAIARPDAKRIYEAAIERLVSSSGRVIDRLHAGSLQNHLAIIIGAIVVAGMLGFVSSDHMPGLRAALAPTLPAIVVWAILASLCVYVALRHEDRLLTLILTSAVGLIVSLIFLQFSGPDLALTQISVDIVTTVLLLLALNLLPKTTPKERMSAATIRDGAVAAIAGFGAAGLAYAMMSRDVASISSYHLAQSKPGGGGTNVVNVILVDIRGFDTFGEIIVLGIAAVAIYALLDPILRTVSERRSERRKAPESRDAHPLILVVATRALLPLALTVGLFVLLRGHNLPGGGFIAGLVVAIALIVQYMASGYAWAAKRAKIDPESMIGGGIVIAGLTGMASWFFARPFLTSTFGYFKLPIVGQFELASAMAFDIGVFLTVVGVVLLSLAHISRVEGIVDQDPSDDAIARIRPEGSAAERRH